jgi:hypothetical protein
MLHILLLSWFWCLLTELASIRHWMCVRSRDIFIYMVPVIVGQNLILRKHLDMRRSLFFSEALFPSYHPFYEVGVLMLSGYLIRVEP